LVESSGHSLEACIQAWRDRRPHPSAAAGVELADYLFSCGDFDGAIAAYANCEPITERIRAKRGWCLAVLDRCDEAANFLTPENCGSSSAELAVLAATVAGGWNRRKLYGGSGVSAQEVQTRRKQVEELVQRALHSTTPPDQLAFFAYMDLLEWYEDREAALAVVERGLTLYPLTSMTEGGKRGCYVN
jgi:tetratricopeptide (TPR) repeat protein